MNYVSIAIGVTALLFGVYTLYARIKTPIVLKKLDAMKKAFGDRAGIILHTISYIIVPLAVGIIFIITGVNGKSII